jgi:hypothetical protein
MSATYWVLISDDLVEEVPDWGVAGLDLIKPDDGLPPPGGARWWQVRDELADPALEGRRVELIFESRDGEPRISDRIPR